MKYIKHTAGIRQWKDKHKGETCVIIGTGPSLNNTNLKDVGGTWIGVNTFYKHPLYDRCSYWCVVDDVVWRNHKGNIRKMNKPIFRGTENGPPSYPNEVHLRRRSPFNGIKNWGNLAKGIYTRGTVVASAIELAYYLGFLNIYITGCDCNYSPGKHHFDGSNVDNHKRTDWTKIFNSYKNMFKTLEKNGRNLFNGTHGGDLHVLPRAELPKIGIL